MKKSKFVVAIVGGDGVGKSTLCDGLKDSLPGDVKLYRQPGGTKLGEYLRSEVLFSEDIGQMSNITERLAFILSHSDMMDTVRSEDAEVVILDRFSPISNRVYERYGEERSISWMTPIYKAIDGVAKPDLIIFLDHEDHETAIKRSIDRSTSDNKYDFRSVAWKLNILRGYRYVVSSLESEYNIKELMIRASDSREEVLSAAMDIIMNEIKKQGELKHERK